MLLLGVFGAILVVLVIVALVCRWLAPPVYDEIGFFDEPFKPSPRPSVGLMIDCPKISNPAEIVRIFHKDLGEKLMAYDVNGSAYQAYTSCFELPNGEHVYSITDKLLADKESSPTEFRYSHDCEVLRGHDLDLLTAKIL